MTKLRVQVFQGDQLLREEPFDRDIIKIGRLASAHLKLDDPKVARIHAVIEATSDGAGFSIIDMGSTDGTFVNGQRVSKERLHDGDQIIVGDRRLVVSIGGEAVASVVPVPDIASEAPAAAAPEPAAPTPAAVPAAAEPAESAQDWLACLGGGFKRQ